MYKCTPDNVDRWKEICVRNQLFRVQGLRIYGCHTWCWNCLSFLDDLSSPPVFNGVRVARSLVFCEVFCTSLFVLFILSIVLSVLLRNCRFWSPLLYLQSFFFLLPPYLTSIYCLPFCHHTMCHPLLYNFYKYGGLLGQNTTIPYI